jgi:hypothetical protein
MPNVHELLKLAQDCFAQARITKDPEARRSFVKLGDEYMQEADDLRQDRSVVQAVFPKPN